MAVRFYRVPLLLARRTRSLSFAVRLGAGCLNGFVMSRWPRALGLIGGRGSATDDLSGVQPIDQTMSRVAALWRPLVWLAFDCSRFLGRVKSLRSGDLSYLPLSGNPSLLLGFRA